MSDLICAQCGSVDIVYSLVSNSWFCYDCRTYTKTYKCKSCNNEILNGEYCSDCSDNTNPKPIFIGKGMIFRKEDLISIFNSSDINNLRNQSVTIKNQAKDVSKEIEQIRANFFDWWKNPPTEEEEEFSELIDGFYGDIGTNGMSFYAAYKMQKKKIDAAIELAEISTKQSEELLKKIDILKRENKLLSKTIKLLYSDKKTRKLNKKTFDSYFWEIGKIDGEKLFHSCRYNKTDIKGSNNE